MAHILLISLFCLMNFRFSVDESQLLTIQADEGWQRSNIRVQPDEHIEIQYIDGKWRSFPADEFYESDGGASNICLGEGCVERLEAFPQGGLIGRIGEGEPFPVGYLTGFTASQGGELSFRMNDAGLEDNEGHLVISVTISKENYSKNEREVTVQARGEWQNTQMLVKPSNTVYIQYTRELWQHFPDETPFDAEGGNSFTCMDGCIEPLAGFPQGGLIGRVGEGEPFAVGNTLQFTPEEAGILQLRMNDTATFDNSGFIKVLIFVIPKE